MANLRLGRLTLIDNFPGEVDTFQARPSNGWDNTTDCFKTTSADGSLAYQKGTYPMGTKIQAYTDNTAGEGWYTMMYGAFHCYTTGTTEGGSVCSDLSVGNFMCSHVGQACGSHTMFDTSAAPWYVMGSCYTAGSCEISEGSPVAIPCWSADGDGSNAYLNGYGDSFGWFWVGGVLPCAEITFLKGLGDSFLGPDLTVACDRGQQACGTTEALSAPHILHDATQGAQFIASACAV